MDRSYWEKIAPGYNDEIFDVLQNDKKKLIVSAIRKVASPAKTVMDAGCAVGKWLPVLSPLFKQVIAADISAGNLGIAKQKYPLLGNVDYLRTDLSSARAKLPACDVMVCINAILTDSMKKRDAFFSNIAASLRKNGELVLVVPSLESWMLTRIIQQKYKIDRAVFSEKIAAKAAAIKYANAQNGNLDIDNVPTKHYIKEELQLLLGREGFTVNKFQKIEYEWNTEFLKSPEWLIEPRPWDWLVVATRGKKVKV